LRQKRSPQARHPHILEQEEKDMALMLKSIGLLVDVAR
jgi:hypothetical protein